MLKKNLLLSFWPIFASEIYRPEEAVKILGYDPKITLLKETDPTIVCSARKTVYFHGFGASKGAVAELKTWCGSERLPGDIVTFNFPDAVTVRGLDTTKSSLGQWDDMKTALYVLKKMHESGEKSVGITAHSRGGAAAVNMVAALADKTDKYDVRLAEMGIDAAERREILRMLQNGHMVLECPLANVQSVVKHQIRESWIGATLKYWFGSFSESSISASAASADLGASLVVKKYRPWGEQAIKSAEKWNGANIATLVHFQKEDEVLGNEHDAEFYAKLCASNGDRTYQHVGANGGHNSSFRSFVSERNRFLKMHGAAYKEVLK